MDAEEEVNSDAGWRREEDANKGGGSWSTGDSGLGEEGKD